MQQQAEGVTLRATIAVVYVPERARAERQAALASSHTSHDAFAAYEPQTEQWDAAKRMPNRLSAWLDPFWEGETVCDASGRAVFRVDVTLRPLPFPRVAQPQPEAMRTLGDQVKLHFFSDSELAAGEVQRNFMYAAIVPLAVFFRPEKKARYYRAYSYIRCDVSPNPIMGLRVAVCDTSAHIPQRGVAVLSLRAPEVADHVRVMALTDWIAHTFTERLFPKHKSVFCDMRTTFRNPRSSGLFQDIPALFALPWTELPFSVGLYALLTALLVNGLRPVDATTTCRPLFSSACTDGSAALLRLRVARDAIACFTLCHVEGVYWPDTSLGISTEDQPFPLSFMPSERVFPKDDCEGRASQAQVMKLLYQCMHRRLMQLQEESALRAEVEALPSFRHLLGTLDDATVGGLLREACALGGLLEAGALDVQTTVGDVHFKSMGEAKRAEAVGHSFAVAVQRVAPRAALVVETTGWSRRYIPEADGALSAAEQAMRKARAVQTTLRDLCGLRGPGPTPNVCGLMDAAEEASSYERLLLGHGCLYFMAGGGAYPYYGIGVPALRAPQFVERWQGPTPPTHGFSIDTRAFLTHLCGDASPRLWPTVPGARQALEWYDAIQANAAMHRRCLRPPPKTHATLEAVLAQRWQPITAADVRGWTPTAGGLFFSVPQALGVDEAQVCGAFARQWPGVRLQSLPFMGSRLYQLHHP